MREVVDDGFRVRGIENLYVSDASVLDPILRANTHLPPTLAIAEQAADLLRHSG